MSRNIGEGAPAAPARAKPRRTTSAELMGPDGRELVIEHAGEEYRLRITSTGKLILTK